MEARNERRLLVWATIALFVLAPTSTGCGPRARPKPAVSPSTEDQSARPARASLIDPSLVDGHWQWSHVEQHAGARRVETEHWMLHLHKDTLRGHYDRVVTFLSLDGVPFECSQSLSYRLVTRYQVTGTVDSRHFHVAETDYTVTPSPCEGGYRHMGEYVGTLERDELRLEWDGGRQTLTRAPEPNLPANHQPTVAGAWRWRNRSPGHDQTIRVESEEWELREAKGGALTGTYLRTVTVFDPDGSVFSCNGNTYYRYRDRYSVRGTRSGRRLMLSEVDVEPDKNPCLPYTERHLDAATGRVDDGFMQLQWRGRHRQVLHRPDPRALSQ